MLKRADRLLGHLESVASFGAAVIMFLIMVIVATDVVMRYLFNSPLGWAYDFISLYLMAALFYLALSATFTANAHIGVDILQGYMSRAARRLCQIVLAVTGAAFFAAIAWVGIGRTWDDYTSHSVAAGAIPWPSWLADILVPIGAILIALRLILHGIGQGRGLLGLRDAPPLPPLAGSPDGSIRGFE